jgi:endonuclease YncB( thermonuclease family)
MTNLKLKLDSLNDTISIETSQTSKYDGRVEIHGKIDLKQFFYLGGESDADTVKITMYVNGIRFRKNDQSEWQDKLTLFNNAKIGANKIIDSKGRMKIRLQGIDAPEYTSVLQFQVV